MEIDIVYTWVDGGDPEFQALRRRYQADAGMVPQEAVAEARYADNDELAYSLLSVRRFAPWVRRIFVVTNGQYPRCLRDDDAGVTVVRHADIFSQASDLPTFNSHAIEAHLHRIPGLAERFVYFNDDVFLGRPCVERDFYTEEGYPKAFTTSVRPRIRDVDTDLKRARLARDNSHRLAVLLSRKAVLEVTGRRIDHELRHLAKPMLRSVLFEMESLPYGEALARTSTHRFRAADDVVTPHLFAFHALAVGRARAVYLPAVRPRTSRLWSKVFGWRYGAFVDLSSATLDRELAAVMRNRPFMFCLNSGPSVSPDRLERMRAFLSRYYGHAAGHVSR